jgi:hypothetical protein
MTTIEFLVERLPASIEQEMKRWRAGLTAMPIRYITFRKEQALEALASETTWIIHSKELVRDGWGDDMKFIQAIIELPDETLKKIKFTDSATWMERCKHGGWSLFKSYKRKENALTSP